VLISGWKSKKQGGKSMSAAAMMKRIAKASRRPKAGTAGALYLPSVLTAAFTELFVGGRWNLAGGLIAVAGVEARNRQKWQARNHKAGLVCPAFSHVELVRATWFVAQPRILSTSPSAHQAGFPSLAGFEAFCVFLSL
jgi:hypothetical protein